MAFAQRDLHWGRIDVSAHLGPVGDLHVVETQTMVFSGAWNGGERRFRIRPGQKLSFEGIYRGTGTGWRRLTEDTRIDDVDEYAWSDSRTLRWRSRRGEDAPFNDTVIRYELRYVLSGILLKEAEGYRLDHDFAFPDRSGPINVFVLRFTHDPAWQPMSAVRPTYTAGPLPPGRGFVLNVPMRYSGADVPAVADLSRPFEIRVAVAAILGFTVLAVAWFFVREQSWGRFAALPAAGVEESWLHEHILKHPAEVVGAAWDGSIGSAEVVALISRMAGEGKLESEVGDDAGVPSMTLRLKVDRSTLEGYEGTLVSWLFFDNRSETTTAAVKANYRDQGFKPATEIRPELEARVQLLFPSGRTPRAVRVESIGLFVVGVGALLFAWLIGSSIPWSLLLLALGALVLAGAGWLAGVIFRNQLDAGRLAALGYLTPALILAAGAAAYLWFYAGAGLADVSNEALVGIAALTLGLVNASINSLRSRQSREAIALRKTFTAAREFFVAELRKPQPSLRDEWYPYLLAFGLARAADDWSARRSEQRRRDTNRDRSSDTRPSSAPSPESWSGFGGGRSGGGGASASWAAAADGMAAGVSAPIASSSSSSFESYGGGSSSSSSSSSSGSSGGGGGGGW